jgi:PAS domain S-box-containing protein
MKAAEASLPASIREASARLPAPETPARPRAAEPAGQPPIRPHAAGTEERLRAVIEAAPASILVATSEGRVLAANRAALTLLNVGRLEELLGSSLVERVADEERDGFRNFITAVCQGEPASLEYRLAGETPRSVETRAVPLARDGAAPAAFLGVTWDVTDRSLATATAQRQAQVWHDLLMTQMAAQREAYERTIGEVNAAGGEAACERARERKGLAQVLRDARRRLRDGLADAAARHAQAAAAWEAEREALQARVRAAEERQQELSAQLIEERNARQTAAAIADLADGDVPRGDRGAGAAGAAAPPPSGDTTWGF